MPLLDVIFLTRTSNVWLEKLEAAGVPAGPIYKMDEVFADPQVQHIGIAVPCHHDARGDIAMVMKISPQLVAISGAPPPPGSRTFGLS